MTPADQTAREDRQTQERFLATLGQRIRGARIKRGMTQTDLASEARLDRAYLSGVENGKHNITIGAILRLSAALEVAPETLVALSAPGDADLPRVRSAR